MFNDLTGAQDQSASKVDDIFAETDKAQATGASAQIETRLAGLSSGAYPGQNLGTGVNPSYDDEEVEGAHKGNKIMKIAIFSALGAVLILGGYLVYSKFLAPQSEVPANENVAPVQDQNPAPVVDNKDDGSVVPVTSRDNATSTTNLETNASSTENLNQEENTQASLGLPVDTDGDGLSDVEEAALGTNPNLVDSDSDGLSDYDEVKIHFTNPLKKDTDDDGLDDYQEVSVYGTNPLNPDSDGDTYKDGDEVKSGYNPLGDGKMPGIE